MWDVVKNMEHSNANSSYMNECHLTLSFHLHHDYPLKFSQLKKIIGVNNSWVAYLSGVASSPDIIQIYRVLCHLYCFQILHEDRAIKKGGNIY